MPRGALESRRSLSSSVPEDERATPAFGRSERRGRGENLRRDEGTNIHNPADSERPETEQADARN